MYQPQELLDARVTFYWRISRLLRLSFFSLPFSIVIFFVCLTFTEWWVGALITTLYLLQKIIYALIWPSLEYKYYRFELREHDMLVQHGVLFRKWSSIPLHRIQHVDTHQGPLQRIVGLVSLQLYTAAGHSSDGSIPGLLENRATTLRDQIIQKRGDDGV